MPEVEPLSVVAAAALEALESAEVVRQRWESAVRAKELADKILAAKIVAERMRVIASNTGSVVTKMLPKSCPLRVNEDGVLGAMHEGRAQWVAMDLLSEGERCEIGAMVAIEAVGEGGVLPLRQEVWQSLDVESKATVARLCESHKVWVVSGEVAEGPLRVGGLE